MHSTQIPTYTRSLNTHMLRVLGWIVKPLFLITTLPICVVIAIMDSNNGRGFRNNLREIMGDGKTK